MLIRVKIKDSKCEKVFSEQSICSPNAPFYRPQTSDPLHRKSFSFNSPHIIHHLGLKRISQQINSNYPLEEGPFQAPRYKTIKTSMGGDDGDDDMDEGVGVNIPNAMIMNASNFDDESVDESFLDLEDKSFLLS